MSTKNITTTLMLMLLLLCGCKPDQDRSKPMDENSLDMLSGIDNKLYIIAEKLERIAVALERR